MGGTGHPPGGRYAFGPVLGDNQGWIEVRLTSGNGRIKPMSARRFWTYPKGANADYAPLVLLGGDEYGNSVLDLNLPGGRGLRVAYNWPLRRELEPREGRTEYGWALDEPPIAEWEWDIIGTDPTPVEYAGRLPVPPRYHLVSREVMYGPWERVD